MSSTHAFRVNDPYVVHDTFEDGEAVLINLETGNYYSLNAVGAEVWAAVGRGTTAAGAVEAVLARYEADRATVAESVARFFDELVREGLAVAGPADPAAAEPPPAAAGARLPYADPALERYNDMRELLLLDPIHDVEETGWPNRKAETAD